MPDKNKSFLNDSLRKSPSRPVVQEILDFYRSENVGVLTNLSRILQAGRLAGTGKLVILPVDQGFEHGPIPSFAPIKPDLKSPSLSTYDPLYYFKLAITSGCSAYSAPLGFLQAGASQFAGQIPLILKINNADSLYKSVKGPCPALTAGVEQALQLGCVAIGFTIYPGSEKSQYMYEQVARVAEQAKKHGLVVVIWAYPRGAGLSQQGETAVDVVAYSAHIACQLGAHIIKVKPPQNFVESEKCQKIFKQTGIKMQTLSDRVRLVIQSAFNGRRILIFSGGFVKEKQAFIQEIKQLAKGGAFGSIVGRNAFQRPFKQAQSLLKEVMDIYKNV